ncbi:MAG TPA: hypothetical protein VGL53_00365 [Bryobacteraceae bacterium]|jgi:hypothetical protein
MTPEQRITNYLMQNQSRLQSSSSVDAVVSVVKQSVFYGFSSGLTDAQIRQIVVRWATVYAVGLLITVDQVTPGSADPGPHIPTDTELDDLVASVKKVIKTVGAGVNLVGKDSANIKLKVTGLTANLKGSDGFLTVGASWGGSVVLKANKGPFFLDGEIGSDKWELTLSFGRDSYVPNLVTLPTVMEQGESSAANIARAVGRLSSVSDVRNITSQIKPDLAKVGDAFDAVSGIADTPKKTGVSFGFKIGSPTAGPGEQGMPGGVQGMLVITWVI